MSEKVSPILKILTEMRDELRQSNSRLGVAGQRLQVARDRLEIVGRRLEVVGDGEKEIARHLFESEMRMTTELVATRGVLEQVRDTLVQSLQHRDRIDDHERRISTLERKAL